MVPKRIIPRLSISVLSGLGSIVHKETNKLSIPDKLLDHEPQRHITFGKMPIRLWNAQYLSLFLSDGSLVIL
jgi:hypothetical protein